MQKGPPRNSFVEGLRYPFDSKAHRIRHRNGTEIYPKLCSSHVNCRRICHVATQISPRSSLNSSLGHKDTFVTGLYQNHFWRALIEGQYKLCKSSLWEPSFSPHSISLFQYVPYYFKLYWGHPGLSHTAPWFTVTPQPATLSELLCSLGVEGCAVIIYTSIYWEGCYIYMSIYIYTFIYEWG